MRQRAEGWQGWWRDGRTCYTADMATNAIHIDLVDMAEHARQHLESGKDESMDEVMQDAVRALDRERAAFEEMPRRKVQEALDDPRPPIPIDEAFAELDRRIAARRAR